MNDPGNTYLTGFTLAVQVGTIYSHGGNTITPDLNFNRTLTVPVTVTNNGGQTTYTFTENGSFTFEFVGVAGNTGSAMATGSNIQAP